MATWQVSIWCSIYIVSNLL